MVSLHNHLPVIIMIFDLKLQYGSNSLLMERGGEC